MITIQGGCLALRYTVTYVNGVPSTNKALVYYTGVQSGGGYLQGDVVQTLSVSGVSIYVPPPAPLVFTLDQVRSQCQFTINVAGTLTGYGASGPSPNPLFSISAVASLVSAQLGIAASAVQVCVHVTYAYLSNQRGEVYVLLSGNSTVNVTSIAAIGNTTVTSSPSVIVVTPSAPSSSSGAPIPSSSSSVSAALSSSTGVSLGASSVTSSAASPLTSSSSTGRSSGGSVVGDPQFVGLLGQSYQVHGIDGAVYNLISDQAGALLINARFTFLTAGRCPTRVNATNCWTHRGSYLTEVGVVAPSGERLYIGSGAADDGFSMVSVDGVELAVGSTYTTATTTKSAADGTGLTVTRPTAWTVEFAVGNFALTVENSDRFVNLVAVRVVEWDKLSSHGLLGQTWRAPSTRGIDVAVVEGSVDDYAEADNELMGGGFVYQSVSMEQSWDVEWYENSEKNVGRPHGGSMGEALGSSTCVL